MNTIEPEIAAEIAPKTVDFNEILRGLNAEAVAARDLISQGNKLLKSVEDRRDDLIRQLETSTSEDHERSFLTMLEWPARWAVAQLREKSIIHKSDTAAKTYLGRMLRKRYIILSDKGLYRLNEFFQKPTA